MTAVSVEVEAHVATITIDAPATRNALDIDSASALVEICDAIDRNPDVGAVIVRGAGGTFCSGAARTLLSTAGEDPAEDERYRSVEAIYSAFTRVGRLAVPSIAAVRGAAVGAGVNLMLAPDLRIVAVNARVIAGFQQIGIHPGGGHFTLMNRLAGKEATAAISLFGEEITGSQAQTLHLAWEAVEDDQVEPRAIELARAVARDPELARRSVDSFRNQVGPPALPWAAAVALERANQMWSLRRKHNPGGSTS